MITSMVIVIMLMQIMMSVLSYLCNRTTNSAMCIFIFTDFLLGSLLRQIYVWMIYLATIAC